MANGHGGYRAPAHPAAVSGPGQHSQRTDGGPGDKQALRAPTGQDYGMRKQEIDSQRVAPLPQQQGAPSPPPSEIARQAAQQGSPQGFQMPTYQGVPLTAPSQRPGEPVTTPAPQNTAAVSTVGPMAQMLSQMAPTDASGVIAKLLVKAQQLGV